MTNRQHQIRQNARNILTTLEGVAAKQNLGASPEHLLTDRELITTICDQWYRAAAERLKAFNDEGKTCGCECATVSLYEFTLPADEGQLPRAKGVIDEARDLILSIPPAILTLTGPDVFATALSFIDMLEMCH